MAKLNRVTNGCRHGIHPHHRLNLASVYFSGTALPELRHLAAAPARLLQALFRSWGCSKVLIRVVDKIAAMRVGRGPTSRPMTREDIEAVVRRGFAEGKNIAAIVEHLNAPGAVIERSRWETLAHKLRMRG